MSLKVGSMLLFIAKVDQPAGVLVFPAWLLVMSECPKGGNVLWFCGCSSLNNTMAFVAEVCLSLR